MLLPKVSQVLILLHILIHPSLAAPASSTNASNVLSAPQTPGFRLQGKVIYPRQPEFDPSAMLLLTLQMLYEYSKVPWYVPAYNTELSGSNICIALTNMFDPTGRYGSFQNRHAMWALWQAAVQQATQDNRQPGVFGLQVLAGAQWTDVAIMTYTRYPEPLHLVAAPGDQTADIASRSNEPRTSNDALLPSGTSSTNFTAVSSTANNSVGSAPYPVVIGKAGSRTLDMVKVFTTICEAMIQRANMRRGALTGQWVYDCQTTGYKIILQRPSGWSENPPYVVVMGGMANLLEAMIDARRDKETAFDVLLTTGDVALQGRLVDRRAGEAESGLNFA